MFYVYILSNEARTLYIGVTNDLTRRISQHREGEGSVFAKRYELDRLVYYETFHGPADAIKREKALKGWRRQRKVDLIEAQNPAWDDLFRLN